jgi:prophage maintenance system killer protein
LTEQGRAVLDLVERYAESWRLLSAYDEGNLPKEPKRPIAPAAIPAEDVRRAIKAMAGQLKARSEAGALFGQERGDALDRILGSIEQTFGGQALYPSAQSRAAHLFYFIIKDHPFSDGNKRIGTLMFVDYLRRVGLWLSADGTPRFANNALVALALLIAESAPKQKDLMIRLIITFLEDVHP